MKFGNFSLQKSLVLVFIFSLVISGCGKKRRKAVDGKDANKVAENIIPEVFTIDLSDGSLEVVTTDTANIPLYEETEDFFDDETLSEFALSDDEMELNLDLSPSPTMEISLEDEDVISDMSLDFSENDIDNELLALDDDGFENEYEFNTLHFELNYFGLKGGQDDLLAENIDAAKSAVQEGKEIIIQGHGCQLGEATYNLALSEKRALTVKNILIEQGVPEEKVRIIGMGQEVPIVWSDNEDKQSLIDELSENRRAEILVN